MIVTLSITLLAAVNVGLIWEILGLRRRLHQVDQDLAHANSRIARLEDKLSQMDWTLRLLRKRGAA